MDLNLACSYCLQIVDLNPCYSGIISTIVHHQPKVFTEQQP
jgi:hypothetical protein